MRFHKEGFATIIIVIAALIIFNLTVFLFFCNCSEIFYLSIAVSLFILFIVLQFFRNPKFERVISENEVISPADGTVVVIEETEENEYFKEKKLKVSVFMSVWNVHINRYPISGIVKYVKYHKGKFLFAINPKSSEENERTTIVIENKDKKEILFRQIAGVMARRIVFYPKKDMQVQQSEDCGFIKFGSRVDIFLPLDAKLKVKIGDKVKGAINVIASL